MNYDNFYENLEEASFRLNGTVVLYDGNPVYVATLENHKDGIVRVNIMDLPLDPNTMTSPSTRKMINSPKFNKFRPFEVGNMNYLSQNGNLIPLRVERIPARTRMQGANSTNMRISMVDPRLAAGAAFNWNNLICNEGFVEMVKNIYPTLPEFFESETPACCLSRDLTVNTVERSGVCYVFYKMESIGILNTNGSLFLFPKYNYLKESLDAARIFSEVKVDFFK
jgi:hypothetical protein